jgi:PilZ domain
MGAWLGRRTEPRVDFRETVRVIWPGEVSGMLGQAVNLSPTGILIDTPTPTPCAVGSDILCDVALPRGPRLLRGRVAHRRAISEDKVGMGIEFIDLSERESAELRTVVEESDEKPQRVQVHFEGTNQVVRARALATEDGFKLVTSLPFLKAHTAVDIVLSPDAEVSARGKVAGVTFDHGGPEGSPRLLIDVRLTETGLGDQVTPVVEAIPECIWDVQDQGVTAESREPPAHDGRIVTSAYRAPSLPVLTREDLDAITIVEDLDRTQFVPARPTTWRLTTWRLLTIRAGIAAGVLGLAFFALTAVRSWIRTSVPPRAPLSIDLPVIGTPPPAPAPLPAQPVLPSPTVATGAVAPADDPTPEAAPATGDSSVFTVGLVGSLAGAHRYPLRAPDGVAFNLPHARPSTRFGTFQPSVPGLRSVWVRPLPGGGTNVRFFFHSSGPSPRVELKRDAVRVLGG